MIIRNQMLALKQSHAHSSSATGGKVDQFRCILSGAFSQSHQSYPSKSRLCHRLIHFFAWWKQAMLVAKLNCLRRMPVKQDQMQETTETKQVDLYGRTWSTLYGKGWKVWLMWKHWTIRMRWCTNMVSVQRLQVVHNRRQVLHHARVCRSTLRRQYAGERVEGVFESIGGRQVRCSENDYILWIVVRSMNSRGIEIIWDVFRFICLSILHDSSV